MKKDKSKSKSHETNIGKIIYGFLLFMPLIAIAVTCAYAIFNKNAYQSYAETISNTYLINSTNTSLLREDKEYIFNGTKNVIGTSSTGWNIEYKFTFTNESVNLRQYFNVDYDIDGIGYATDGLFNTYFRPYFHDKNNDTWLNTKGLIYFNRDTYKQFANLNFTFTLKSYENNFYEASNIISYVNTKGNLDNVFYYSIDKVEQSNLFNWAQNSIIYTTLTATCTALSINNTFIPLLLAYWLIISVIYILYDIALVMLMIFHRKVHELQECI